MKIRKEVFLVILFISSCRSHSQLVHLANESRIKTDLAMIVETPKSRNYKNPEILDTVAMYITRRLMEVCDTVYLQPFSVNSETYYNVVGSIGVKQTDRIIIGAHYDVCGDQPGADDNASGVAGLLELARLLSKDTLKCRVDFVAYSLEEPPFFGTEYMGSYFHAKSLYDSGVTVKGMICLEMIGYFSDKRHTQRYPLPFMKMIYGSRGNFITVVRKMGKDPFGKKFYSTLKKQDQIKTISFRGPESLPGVDFSDHRNYWKFGIPAVMITNSSFYRNHNYHTPDDKLSTLDIGSMCKVIDEMYLAVKKLGN